MNHSPRRAISVDLTAKDITLLNKFMKEEAGRLLDMRIPSARLIWQILTQIKLRSKNNE